MARRGSSRKDSMMDLLRTVAVLAYPAAAGIMMLVVRGNPGFNAVQRQEVTAKRRSVR
jgi:hypothetical protein